MQRGIIGASGMLAGLLMVVALVCPVARSWAEPAIAGTLEIDAPDQVELSYVDLEPLAITTTPARLEAGISCGMEEMCGIDPCLCGAPDEFGACACNGFMTIEPELTVTSSDTGVVRPVTLGGTVYLLSVGRGDAQVVITGTLAHYESAQTVVQVTVNGFTWADAGKLAFALLILAAVAAGIVALVRACGRAYSKRTMARGALMTGFSGDDLTDDSPTETQEGMRR